MGGEGSLSEEWASELPSEDPGGGANKAKDPRWERARQVPQGKPGEGSGRVLDLKNREAEGQGKWRDEKRRLEPWGGLSKVPGSE